MALDPRLEKIFAAWYDYEHAGDEDEKHVRKQERNALIESALRGVTPFVSLGDFLHAYLPEYRRWVIRKGLSRPRF